ncbi:sulfatase-like hydrolase/transferase [Pedobacter gandavensis]|uniref:sulfatase-like hydrolase/transferase n=1 Tax=Pedobacter gandavensis TaxID=2679963 RepID=UPI00247B0B2C|nr:sulfatase-like hydrolase/transferase [Pedobacter gandavensis]WGQ11620.1 sulfatase-like hydrolase/transferase [Pedobacter gandavensis]
MMKRTWRTTIMVFMLPIAVIPTSVKAQNQQKKEKQLNQAMRGNPQRRVASQKVEPSKKSAAPNIIFILTDDMGYGDLGVFFQNQRKDHKNLPYQLTPNLDQMAASGAKFTNQYSNAPVCAPSRASFMTGMNQGNASVRDNQFDKQIENNHTIANMLKSAGYATAAIGKWGLQGETKEEPNWPAHPSKRGFDQFFGYMRHADGHEHYPFEGLYRGKKEVYDNYTNVAADLSKSYTTDLWTAYAKKWIVAHEQGKSAKQPFFMFLAYDAPHAVLELPTQAYPAGAGLKGGVQWTGKKGAMINTASGEIDTYVHPDYANATYDDDQNLNTPEKPWPDTYKRYATANRRIDDAIGDVIQLLKDLKIDENTLVVFSSDNGPSIESYLPKGYVPNSPEFFGSFGPFDGIKRDVWEGGLRMPVLARWPSKINPGQTIDLPSMLSDWMPTFAEAANIPAPARLDGISLLPTLIGKGKQEQGQVYIEYTEGGNTPDFKEFEASRRGRKRNQMQMIRIGDLAGVRYNIKSADDDFEIYDVVKDPKEKTNLGGDVAYRSLQEKMKAKVLQGRKVDAEAPRPYDTALIPGLNPIGNLTAGINWKFFKGDFSWVVTEKGRIPLQKGTTTSLENHKTPKLSGMMLYEAWFKAPRDGEYSFSLASNGKAYLRLHEAELLDADYDYSPRKEISTTVKLKAGYHPIKIYAKQEQGKAISLRLKQKEAGANWQDMSDKDLFIVK